MKVVSDSDLIPVTCSEVKAVVFGAKRADVLIVLEVTGIGQLEFGFLFIFLVSFLLNQARRRRGGNVGIRPPLAGFPSPVERVGNSF